MIHQCFLLLLLVSVSFAAHLSFSTEEFVRTPGGMLPSSCVYEVPSGTQIIHNENKGAEFHHPDGTVRKVGPCEVPLLDQALPPSGWQVYTYWVGPKNINSFTGYWNVPAAPDMQGQILYLFTGLQNNCGGYGLCPDNLTGLISDTTNILQPVLQYGSTPAGGGNFWGIASWYVASFGTAHTTVSQVAPGDMLYGSMIKTEQPNTWVVYFNDTTNSTVTPTTLTVKNALTATEPDAYVTLETYDIASCGQYPTNAVTKFTQMVIEVGNGVPKNPQWDINTYSSACNEKVVVVNSGEVDIYW